MNKQANIQKAISLMKSKGMSAEQALKTVYPDWDEAQIKKAAMTIRTMDKTAAVMQIGDAMTEFEKQAAILPALVGGGAGYLKGEEVGRGAEGAIRGGLGTVGGSLGATALSAPLTLGLLDKSISQGKSGIGAIGAAAALSALGGLTGYKLSTMGINKPKKKSKYKPDVEKVSSAKKATFSPAMDKSPLLKGKQSKLPDQIQAKILKGKMKKKEKVGGVTTHALRAASNAIYAAQVEKKVGKLKSASVIDKLFGIPSIAQWGTRGAGAGGLLGGLGEAGRLAHLTTDAGRAAHLKRLKDMNNANISGRDGVKRMLPFQKVDPSKGQVAFSNQAKADAEFLKRFDELKGMGGFAKNPTEYLKLFAPKVLANAGAGAVAGGVVGTGAGTVARGMAKKKMMDTAKKVAVPAAIGAGGIALATS